MKYIATREGVEKLAGNGSVTKGQRELIQKLLTDFPDAVELFEYEDYCKTPTLGTASVFISMALDTNLHEIDSESGYMQYIATRPRVQKRGTHGLFSSAAAVDLTSAMSELEAHEGNVWTIIYSLRREDAARLEYDNADAWRTLLMKNAPTLAKSMKISLENFHWYAAFHDEGHHPHIHMMVWSDNPKEGFLTKDGIAAMRSKLTNAIFRDEMQQIYERKDVAYSDLVEAAQNAMREMISRMQHQICDSPIIEDNMRQLVQTLETTTGKKQYGYLKKPLKQLVDTIVDALAELPEVSECYEVWNQIHEELNECYGHSILWERLPLSQRKEFRKIKNDIIREAENIRLGLPTFEEECRMSRSRKVKRRSISPTVCTSRRSVTAPQRLFCRTSMRWIRNTQKRSKRWSSSGRRDIPLRHISLVSSIGMISPPCVTTKKRSIGFGVRQKPVMISRSTPSGSCSSRKNDGMKRWNGLARPQTMAANLHGIGSERSISPVSPCQKIRKRRLHT